MSIIKDEQFPDLPVNSDRVVLMRDRFDNFKRNYEGMLYFCSRILQKPVDQVKMVDLEQFEEARFRREQQMVKNYSWPVGLYLSTIRRLEDKVQKLEGELSRRGEKEK